MRSRGSEAAEGSQLLFPGERELAGGKRAGHPAGFFCHPARCKLRKTGYRSPARSKFRNIHLRYRKNPRRSKATENAKWPGL